MMENKEQKKLIDLLYKYECENNLCEDPSWERFVKKMNKVILKEKK